MNIRDSKLLTTDANVAFAVFVTKVFHIQDFIAHCGNDRQMIMMTLFTIM